MGKWIIAAATVFAWCAEAPARSALVAAGGCEDGQLQDWSKQLAALLDERMDFPLLEGEELTRRLPPAPSRPAADLDRQLDAAARLYFEGDPASADQRVVEALAEIQHLRPGANRWQLYARGLLLRALILRARNLPAEAAEQFRRVLRVNPNHRLDTDYFPPSARAGFNRLRRQLRSEPKLALTVTSDPSGAHVFVDGLDLQKTTPATVELAAGRYSIAVSKGGLFSFPRTVELTSPSSLQVDLAFESSLHPGPIPCLEGTGDEELRLINAVKLGRWLGADQVILVAVDGRSEADRSLSATLVQVDSAQKIREGGIRANHPSPSPMALRELAELILTGRQSGRALAAGARAASPAPEPSCGDGKPQMPATRAAPQEAHRQDSRGSTSKGWAKVLGASLLGAGAIAAGAGVVFHIRSDQARADLNRRYADGTPPPLGELADVQSVRQRAEWQRRAAFASYAFGATAVAAGLLFIFGASSHAPAAPDTAVRAAPGALSIEGSW